MTRSAATISEQLGAFAATAAPPTQVRERATLHLLDTVGCGLAAVGVATGGAASAVAAEQGGREESSVLGRASRVPAPLAGFANGSRFHALDFDDTHEAGICHASAVVAATALALAEARGRSGSALLDAYAVGCEVATRVAIGTADGLYRRGFHPTGVCGAFGAVAAAARLSELDTARTVHALGIVTSFASGLLEYLSDGAETKPLHAGWASQAGIQAVRLAAAGASGPATAIEGEMGLIASHTGEPERAAQIVAALGERWEAAAMSLKPFPACHFAHASTWAAQHLMLTNRLRLDRIDEIVVRIPPEGLPLVLEPLAAKARPRTSYDAKFSLPFTVSHLLVRGSLGISAFDAEAIADPAVLGLAARVRHEPLTDDEAAASRFAGGTRIVMEDGAVHDMFVADPPGSPGNPLGPDWVSSKFEANAALALHDAEVTDLRRRLLGVAAEGTLATIMDLVRAGEPAAHA